MNEYISVSYKRSFLIGCLLGDSSSRRRDYANGRLSAEIAFSHSLKQVDLVEWKATQFELMYGFKPKVHIAPELQRASFWVTKRGRIRVIHDWFHSGRRKIISSKIRFMDHPVGLAMLLCDDGSIRKRRKQHADNSLYYLRPSITIATHCFTEDQVLVLLKHIEGLCGARGYINPERRWRNGVLKEYPRINFNAEESERLWQYVQAYVPQVESMRNKFSFIQEWYR